MTDECGTGDLLELLAATPPPPRSSGAEVDAICSLMRGDPMHDRDRRTIVAAIVADARAHDSHVDPNRVRTALTRTNADGTSDLTVYGRVIGAVYQGLGKSGVLEFTGWTTSTDDHGRNAGRPARTYRLARIPEEP